MANYDDKPIDAKLENGEVPATAKPRRSVDLEAIQKLLDRVDKLPRLDNRSADEIIGYNEFGLFDEEGDFSLTDIEVVKLDGR